MATSNAAAPGPHLRARPSRVGPAALLLVSLAVLGQASAPPEALPEVIRKVQPSTVLILTFDGQGRRLLQGSGFFVGGPGLVLTSRHVLAGASSAVVKAQDGRLRAVRRLVAEDRSGDLALVSTDVPAGETHALEVAAGLPEVGSQVVVVGSPLGLERTASVGIVSAIRDVAGAGTLIQMSAPISPGSSGSPVVDMTGTVVGVSSSLVAGGQNLNFAVPAYRALALKPGRGLTLSAWSRKAAADEEGKPADLLARGRALLAQGNFGAALPLFERAAGEAPDDARARLGSAECLLGLRRLAEAEAAFQKAILLRPEASRAYLGLGRTYAEEGRHRDAIESFQQASRMAPGDAEAYLAMGGSFAELGMDADACRAFQQAVLNDPESVEGYEDLGKTFRRLGRLPQAQEAFKQAVRVRPDAWEAHLLLGEACASAGRPAEAVGCFKEAIRLKPDCAQAHYDLGETALTVGDRGLALEEYGLLKNLDKDLAARLFRRLYR